MSLETALPSSKILNWTSLRTKGTSERLEQTRGKPFSGRKFDGIVFREVIT